MRNMLGKLGIVLFWAAWPAYFIYLRRSRRSRVVVSVPDGRILVVRGWISDGKWTLPGGGIHPKEAPSQGAVRELFEEVGIAADPTKLVPLGGEQICRMYGHRYPFYGFALRLTAQPNVRLQWYELSHAQWLHPRELTTQNAAPDVLQTIAAWQNLIQ